MSEHAYPTSRKVLVCRSCKAANCFLYLSSGDLSVGCSAFFQEDEMTCPYPYLLFRKKHQEFCYFWKNQTKHLVLHLRGYLKTVFFTPPTCPSLVPSSLCFLLLLFWHERSPSSSSSSASSFSKKTFLTLLRDCTWSLLLFGESFKLFSKCNIACKGHFTEGKLLTELNQTF